MTDLNQRQFGDDVLYHGTVHPSLNEVQPASVHGRGSNFGATNDTSYAYATKDPANAWHYAELAYNHADSGVPHVYRVQPINPHDVEADATHDEHGRSRGTMTGDMRSRSGFRVLGQEKMPENMGDPEDWR